MFPFLVLTEPAAASVKGTAAAQAHMRITVMTATPTRLAMTINGRKKRTSEGGGGGVKDCVVVAEQNASLVNHPEGHDPGCGPVGRHVLVASTSRRC